MYVVWLPMLGADARSAIDVGLLDDPRVTQFWDEDRIVGRWLAETGLGGADSAVVWDAYFLFGPDAAWNERPGPLAASGAPVVSTADAVEREAARLLGG